MEKQLTLLETSELLEESFSAAEYEGLYDAINRTNDERLKDLFNRRILYHLQDFRDAIKREKEK